MGGRWAELGVERLKEEVGGAHQGDAADRKPLRAAFAAAADRDCVPDSRLQGRRQLLVQHDLTRTQRAAQEAERFDLAQVAGRHRQDRPLAGAGYSGRAAVGHPGKRRGCRSRGLADVGLAGDPGRQTAGLTVGGDRAL